MEEIDVETYVRNMYSSYKPLNFVKVTFKSTGLLSVSSSHTILPRTRSMTRKPDQLNMAATALRVCYQ